MPPATFSGRVWYGAGQVTTAKPEKATALQWGASAIQPPEAERKVVTALYADLAGHTAIQGRLDPEDWWRFLQEYFTAMTEPIRRYGGSVEKFIGDAIFAVFGVPRAYEDDAERAVRAAIDMQRELQRLNAVHAGRLGAPLSLRIGLATGEAIAPLPSGAQQFVTGELTNLAERLQSQAPSDSITVSERTYEFVAALVDAEAVGPLVLKGFPEMHQAYAVRGLRSPGARARGLGLVVPLVDREREMEVLRQAGRRLLAGQGQVVCVVGEAGLGKSRLVSELLATLRPQATVLEARCHEFTQNIAYGVVVQHLRAYLQLEESEALPAQAAHLADVLPAALAPSADVRETVTHLLGLDVAHALEHRTRGLDPDEVRRRVVEALVAFWQAAASRPLVLVAEDLHWMDTASAAALAELVRLTDRVPLMLLCVLRPERRSAAWEFKFMAERDFPHRYQEIALEPLSMDDTEVLAKTLLEQVGLAAADLQKTVAVRSEGNPFYVEEVVRSLREHGEPAAHLPETLQGVLQARLDALGEPTRRVLQTAAVIGRTFSLRLLQSAVGEETDLIPHLATIQREGFIVEQQFLPERQFTFRHALLQEAAYRRLLRADRRTLHRRLAEIMATEAPTGAMLPVIFHHFVAGETWQEAAIYGVQAANWAREGGATDQAFAYYQQLGMILDVHPDAAPPEAQRRIREPYGDLLVTVGRYDEGRMQYEALRDDARTAAEKAHAERLMASSFRLEGKLDRATEHLRHALLLLSPGADPVEEAWTHLDMGYVEDLIGSDPNSVLAHCERAKVLAAGAAPILNARVFRLFLIAQVHLDQLDAALESGQRAAEFAQQSKDQLEIAIAHNNLADVYRLLGRHAEALEQIHVGLEAVSRPARVLAIRYRATLHGTEGELYLDSGDWDQARHALEQALASLDEIGLVPRIRVEVLTDLSSALVELGRPADAMRSLDEGLKLCEAYPLHRLKPKLFRIRAEAYLRSGDLAAADEACLTGLHAADRYGVPAERPSLLRVCGAVATSRGEGETSVQFLEEAAALMEGREAGLELGRVYLEIGRSRLGRDRARAIEALQRARRVFTRLGAPRFVEETERLLAEPD